MDGAWSFALRPYFKENLTQEFFNEKTKRVWAVEDMYSELIGHLLQSYKSNLHHHACNSVLYFCAKAVAMRPCQ